jgi:hypothetical protein
MTALATYIVGVAVLILGRRLFWIFVAAVGFAAGLILAPQFLPAESPQWLLLAIAIVVGILGAVLAVLLQKIAVGVAGFIAGGYLALWLVSFLNLNLGDFQAFTWAIFVVGGIIGAVLLAAVFDIALIVLSAGAGAGMISYQIMLSTLLPQVAIAAIFIVLFIIGIVIQRSFMRRDR